MAKKTFEEALARLGEISTELEDGDLSLEKSLKKFDEGIKLAEFCNAQLADAKDKVEILLERDGRLEATPFKGADSGDQTVSE